MSGGLADLTLGSCLELYVMHVLGQLKLLLLPVPLQSRQGENDHENP